MQQHHTCHGALFARFENRQSPQLEGVSSASKLWLLFASIPTTTINYVKAKKEEDSFHSVTKPCMHTQVIQVLQCTRYSSGLGFRILCRMLATRARHKGSDDTLACVSDARASDIRDTHLARVAAHGQPWRIVAHLLSGWAHWCRINRYAGAVVCNARAPDIRDTHLAWVAAHGLSRCEIADLLAGWASRDQNLGIDIGGHACML